VRWSVAPEKNRLKYRSEEMLAQMAIDQHRADWIIMSDVDEFLCPQTDDLRTILQRAAAENVTAISIPCFNMTGLATESTRRAIEAQTLRIDRPFDPSCALEELLLDDIPAPFIFIKHWPKTITRASAFVQYGAGTHNVITSWGKTEQFPELRFLHYPIRGFDKLAAKVANLAAFFDENNHLEPWWGWHWRRWIRLSHKGRLREDYEAQFLSPARAEEAIRNGACSVDETIANWSKRRIQVLD